jgi:Rho family protein
MRSAAIFENYVAEIRLDGKPIQLALWDTACVPVLLPLPILSLMSLQRPGRIRGKAGPPPYPHLGHSSPAQRLRPLSYSKSHVILIAYAIDTPDSLENVTVKWMEEVRSICGPTIPVLLVGCKSGTCTSRACIHVYFCTIHTLALFAPLTPLNYRFRPFYRFY